jgi:hypothetical protein
VRLGEFGVLWNLFSALTKVGNELERERERYRAGGAVG